MSEVEPKTETAGGAASGYGGGGKGQGISSAGGGWAGGGTGEGGVHFISGGGGGSSFPPRQWPADLCDEPHLGLATTEELINEIISRITTDSCTTNASPLTAIERVRVLAYLLGSMTPQEREYRTIGNV